MPDLIELRTKDGVRLLVVPRSSVRSLDEQAATRWLRGALEQPGGAQLLTRIAESFLPDAADREPEELVTLLARRCDHGRLLLVELGDVQSSEALASVGPSGARIEDGDWDDYTPISDLIRSDPQRPSDVEPGVDAPTWCELQLWLLDDGPFSNAELRARLPDGSQQHVTTDADGVCRIEGIVRGNSVDFALVAIPEWSERQLSPPVDAHRVQVTDDLHLAVPVARRTTVVLTRELIFDFDDVTFGNERAVFLPEPIVDHRTDTRPDAARGLVALASVLAFARKHPELLLWIAGHTDAVGTGASDVPLSQARAENVRLMLLGDVDGWAQHTMTVHAVEDLQHALVWIARSRGWDCDPGPCDNDMGPKTWTALTNFREQAAALSGASAVAASEIVADDWRAIARMFDEGLARMLPDDPTAIRSALRELDGSPTACAATRPRRPPPDARVDGTERRVELVFVPQRPGVPAEAQALAEVVYASTSARLRYVPPLESEGQLTWITVRLVHAADGQPISGRRVRLRDATGAVHEQLTDDAGRATFAELPSGGTADVTVLAGGSAVATATAGPYDEIDDSPPQQHDAQGDDAANEPVDEEFEEAEDSDVVPAPPEPTEPPEDTPLPSDLDEVDDDGIQDDDRGAA